MGQEAHNLNTTGIEEYTFQFMVTTVKAQIGQGQVSIKAGLRKWQFPVHAVKHVYVYVQESTGMDEFIITYETNPGKLKKVRLPVSNPQPGFKPFLDSLVAKKPGSDIRHMEQSEAFKLMGAADHEKAALVAVPLIIMSILMIGLMPVFLHGYDDGHEVVTAEKLAAGYEPKSRNITLKGKALSRYIESTTTNKGSTTKKLLIPIVAANASSQSKFRIVLETGELSSTQVDKLIEQKSFKGILRNIWWEGLSSSHHKFFKNEMKMNIADEVLLVDYKASAKTELVIGWVIFGIVSAIIIGITGFMYVAQKKKA